MLSDGLLLIALAWRHGTGVLGRLKSSRVALKLPQIPTYVARTSPQQTFVC